MVLAVLTILKLCGSEYTPRLTSFLHDGELGPHRKIPFIATKQIGFSEADFPQLRKGISPLGTDKSLFKEKPREIYLCDPLDMYVEYSGNPLVYHAPYGTQKMQTTKMGEMLVSISLTVLAASTTPMKTPKS